MPIRDVTARLGLTADSEGFVPDETATQGNTGTATQSTTTGKDGAGAPGDAPPAEESYSLARVQAIAAKEARAGQAKGRKALLEELGVADESELSALLEAGRTVKPKAKDDGERLAEKIKAQADAEKAALQQQIAALQAATEAAMVRDAAKGVLMNAGLVDGGADLVLSMLGLSPRLDHALVVKDGKVAVVDQDGDPTGKSVDQFLTEIVKARPYLRAPSGTPSVRTGGPAPKPKPDGPPRKMSMQEQLDAAVAAGLASVQGANGSGR